MDSSSQLLTGNVSLFDSPIAFRSFEKFNINFFLPELFIYRSSIYLSTRLSFGLIVKISENTYDSLTISRQRGIGKNLGEYSEISSSNCQLLEIPKAKIELYVAPVDGDNNDATNIVPTGAIVCFRVRFDRSQIVYLAIKQKIETLFNEIREFTVKLVTNVTRFFLFRHDFTFYLLVEIFPSMSIFQRTNRDWKSCYPFSPHLAFEGNKFSNICRKLFSITSSRNHCYQSICIYIHIHIYLIFDEE